MSLRILYLLYPIFYENESFFSTDRQVFLSSTVVLDYTANIYSTQYAVRGRTKKNFQRDLHRLKLHTIGVQNIFCLKSYLEGHRIHQPQSLAKSAKSRLDKVPSCWILGLQSWTSNEVYNETLMHSLSPCEGLTESFFSFT